MSAKPKPPREAEILKACLEYLALRGIYSWRNNTTGVFDPRSGKFRKHNGLKGVSDILGVLPGGTFLAVETKRPGGKVTDEQQLFIGTVRKKGGVGLIVHSLRELEDALQELGYA